jgi:glycine betaine/choline ABC-type transport system substrate-binding protein
MTVLKGHVFLKTSESEKSQTPQVLFESLKATHQTQNSPSSANSLNFNDKKKAVMLGKASSTKKLELQVINCGTSDAPNTLVKAMFSFSGSTAKNIFQAAAHDENLSLPTIVYAVLEKMIQGQVLSPFERLRAVFGELPFQSVALLKAQRQDKLNSKVQYLKNSFTSTLKNLPTCSKKEVQQFEKVLSEFAQTLFEFAKTNENTRSCVDALKEVLCTGETFAVSALKKDEKAKK